MKRLLFTIMLMLCTMECVRAIEYTVYVRNADGTPLAGVRVYAFFNRRMAEAAYEKALATEGHFDVMAADGVDLQKTYSLREMQETEPDGSCVVDCIPEGTIILDGDDLTTNELRYDFCMFHVADCPRGKDDYTLELILPSRSTSKWRVGDLTVMRALSVQSTLPVPNAMEGVGLRHGGKIDIIKVLDIDGEHARDDARFVAFPSIEFDDAPDSVIYMPPLVIDGREYARNMTRRMGFVPSRDKLAGFHYDSSLHLQDHNGESVLYKQPADIPKGTKYHVSGILWYEDCNGVYHRDSILFSDGKEKEPMRFLDWSDGHRMVSVNRERYARKGTLESFHENKSFRLQFEQGRSALNLRDSTTQAQRESLLQWLGAYPESNILGIDIRGYSSPEGSEKVNRTLSHGRAATIKAMLQAEFPDVRIETSFDAADNIVSWERVADVMTDEMDDSLAHTYASRLRELIAGKGSMDARYRAVRADAALHDYLCKHVLDRVRMVEVSANIIVQKVLSREEIIERYEHDPAFRTRMEPYQYYVMMCHLADNERWNELYEVSRRAYEGYPRERNARVQVATRDTLGRDVLHFVDRAIPYPLAGYYYAVATQKKNKPDLSILRPFLDDGGLEHAAGRSAFMNEEAFVVAQVLMYCQREDFDGANSLIRKYGLMARPELKGLIMFVRCLDGQYLDDPEVREYVMSTSAMNRAVMYAAMQMYREALIILYGDDVPRDDAKVEYLKAICHFNLLDWRLKSYGCDGYSSSAVYDPDGGQDADATAWNTSAWAAPMLNALRLDSDNLKYLENDGYFNDAYRQMIFYFHTRLQAGVPLAKVAAEYDALVARMRKSKAKDR